MNTFLSPHPMAEVKIQKALKQGSCQEASTVAATRSDQILCSQEATKAAERKSDPIRKEI